MPRKKRQLERLPDIHIAMWLDNPNLDQGDRKRLEEIKKSRRQLSPEISLGILVEQQGVTPKQLQRLKLLVNDIEGLEEVYALRSLRLGLKNVKYSILDDQRAIVRKSNRVVAGPRQMYDTKAGVWDGVRFARHRKIQVVVVLPNGNLYEGDAQNGSA